MTELQQTALHEAGHIMITHILGGRVGFAFALDGYSLDGSRGEADVGHNDPDKNAAICFAGAVAMAFDNGGDYPFIAGSTYAGLTEKRLRTALKPNTSGLVKLTTPGLQTAPASPADIHTGRRTDAALAWRCIRRASKTAVEAADRFDRAQHAAVRLVAENLPTIRALAAVLETEHVMTAEQINGFLGMRKARGVLGNAPMRAPR